MSFLFDFGTMEYAEALEIQREFVAERARGDIPDAMILVEHPHVVTLGRKTSPDNFRSQKIPVFQVERGGDATYHGPGQLVGYPIFFLKDHDVRRHVRGIEEAIIRTTAAYGISGRRLEGHPGVWVGEKKLASIGVAVTDWVSYHGFALNVNTNLSYFELIRPCGLDPSTMTSMQKILGKALPFEEVKSRFVREYSAVAGTEFSHQRLVRHS
ncbi:MAG: lipoyl(octanoyl) transferase LipB [Nitrososphaerota archaeon]|nr:lipoyl(octanoyl) transferase LipB [Nitrososphaerota archaeon]MDG6942826.1 lipoyl(octanoyl) transferase LipB [Nitrososphaerota archaeon]MDG6950854.1 lipoyl(octanoyl) transferase LipB [Nitrososphaerota archaeon]